LTGFGTPPSHLSPGNASVPVALAGLATFDGPGNFTGSFTNSHNGEISTLPADTGTYAVNSDCTGTFTDETAGVHFAIVILDGGAEVFGVKSDIGTAPLSKSRSNRRGSQHATTASMACVLTAKVPMLFWIAFYCVLRFTNRS
jgi:hypothetical protein